MDKNLTYILNQQQHTNTINMQDVIGGLQEKYIFAILVCSAFLLIYVLWNNFVRSPKCRIKAEDYGVKFIIESKKAWHQEFDELAIMPGIFLFVIALTYYTGYEGLKVDYLELAIAPLLALFFYLEVFYGKKQKVE